MKEVGRRGQDWAQVTVLRFGDVSAQVLWPPSTRKTPRLPEPRLSIMLLVRT